MDRMRKKLIRVKGSSLVETLIATIIIMIVFGIAMVSISNILENNIKSSTSAIDTELNKLMYLYENGNLEVPSQESLKEWQIKVEKVKEGEINYILFEGMHKQSKKVRTQKLFEKE